MPVNPFEAVHSLFLKVTTENKESTPILVCEKNNSFENNGHNELVLLAYCIFKHLRLSLADSFSRVLAWLTKARVTKKGSNIPEHRIFLFSAKEHGSFYK